MYNYQWQGSQVFIGDIPAPFEVRITKDNVPIDLGSYDLTPLLFDPDNKRVDIAGYSLIEGSDNTVFFNYPLDRSLFTRLGIYTFQVRLETALGNPFHTLTGTIECLPLGRQQ